MRVKSPLLKIVSGILAAAALLCALCVSALGVDYATVFKNYVAAIENSDSLEERISYEAEADAALEAYISGGGSESDPDIAGSYAVFLQQKNDISAELDLCYDFIDVADAVCSNPELSYQQIVDYLTEADALLKSIDTEYPDVAPYVLYYKEFVFLWKGKVEACEIYVRYAKAAKDAETFAEAKQNYDSAIRAEENIEIEDFPALEEARANLTAASTMMFRKIQDAQEFIRAVENINHAQSVPAGIKAAYEILENNNVDVTAEGADEAIRTLRTAERSYDRKVDQGNDQQSDAALLILGLLF